MAANLDLTTYFDRTTAARLEATIVQRTHHGDLSKWQVAPDALPEVETGWRIDDSVLVAGAPFDGPGALTKTLKTLIPWRKGPLNLGGVVMDTEWRSDWKWNRIAPHLELEGKRVLDIGAGNGYFGWRMLDAGARGRRLRPHRRVLDAVPSHPALHRRLRQSAPAVEVRGPARAGRLRRGVVARRALLPQRTARTSPADPRPACARPNRRRRDADHSRQRGRRTRSARPLRQHAQRLSPADRVARAALDGRGRIRRFPGRRRNAHYHPRTARHRVDAVPVPGPRAY
ncbi:DUF1698 domain-containing protein [Wenzhouxiangella sp. C33]|uniref:DUF1698 domain-containing protein n=1 Tax=Wenzhouxiangella limi TaxID=2707351 RepID=A0A845V0E8_9GAMM|nr:DUF1698 domain-containing protein [Wenzhouxiangella limi]